MRTRTRAKAIAAAVAAGALVLGGATTAWAAGHGWGNPTGDPAVADSASSVTDRHGDRHAKGKGQGNGQGKSQGKGHGMGQGNGQGHSGDKGRAPGSGHQDVNSLDLGVLTPAQEAQMVFLAEEEKMAGDLYEVFFEMYGVKVFGNIASSEDRHTDAVRGLLDSYGLEDPTAGMDRGEFTLPEVQQMYDTLLAQGSESVEAAFKVGVIVEEADIADLQEALVGLEAPRAAAVYEHLLAGSRNHLAAFSR